MNRLIVSVIMLMICMCMIIIAACDKPSLSDPVSTMKTFQAAVAHEDWQTAQKCLCDEIIRHNPQAIASGDIYFVEYWIDTRTIQNAFRRYPVIDRHARFSVVSIKGDNARLLVEYANPRDKDIRLMMITLVKDDNRQWKIAEFYGFNRGFTLRK